MWQFYDDKTILVTGATGFLGTALVHRLITQTSASRIYLLCRGGMKNLQAKWQTNLPLPIARMMYQSNRIVVLEGDVLLPGMGLSPREKEDLRTSTNLLIHAASPINLGRPLHRVSQGIIGATELVAEFAASFRVLERFVYISTAYCNTFLYAAAPHTDMPIDETFYDLTGAEDDPIDEWTAVQKYGTSDTYQANKFPWGYAYAKHLTERLLCQRFATMNAEEKLLIVRPAIIAPAQQFPIPGFCVPMSSPISIVAAAMLLLLQRRFRVASYLPDPETMATQDIVPVDVVVDRTLAHLALGTQGFIHAVSGVRARVSFSRWHREGQGLRRIPWELHPAWFEGPWDAPGQHAMSRLYAVIGTSFAFADDKTARLSQTLSVEERQGLSLFTEVDMVDHILVHTRSIRTVMDFFALKSLIVRLLVWIFYRNFGREGSLSRL